MSHPEEYDVVVLGSGAAGKLLAWTLASQGKRVAVIERRYVGGSCPNIACLPSKNVIHGAKVASYFRRGAEFGIAGGDWTVDMAAVRDRKRKMVDGLVEMHLEKYRESGAELVMGERPLRRARRRSRSRSTRAGRGRSVARPSSSTPGRAPGSTTPPAWRSRDPLTHVEALDLDHLPGAPDRPGRRLRGPRAGAGVPPVRQPRDGRRTERRADPPRGPGRDRGDRATLPGRGDRGPDRDGRRSRRGDVRRVRSAADDAGSGTIEGTHLLVAGGRTPNTDGIGLEKAGVETDERGHVKVNERLRTTAEGVWAVGDCAGSPYFTHIGDDDFRVVLDNLTGGDRVTTGRQVPFCLFTDPELARVGLSEREARERGVGYRLAKIPMEAVLRARTLSETRGFLKALIEADGDRILGLHRVRGRGRRGHGRGPGRDDGRPAVHGAAGRRPDPPDHGRGARRAVLVRPAGMTSELTGVAEGRGGRTGERTPVRIARR